MGRSITDLCHRAVSGQQPSLTAGSFLAHCPGIAAILPALDNAICAGVAGH